MTRVALLQGDVSDDESIDDRVHRVSQLVLDQAGKCDLAVLPELWPTGAFNDPELQPSAQPRTGSFVQSMQELANQASIWLHAGSFVEVHDGNKLSNTSIVIRPDGTIATFYRKIHLFGFDKGEAIMLDRGSDSVVLADTPVGTAGIATCYDLRFPELFRELTHKGAQSFVLCSGWPTPRISHWRTLIQARAIENQAWFVACNEVGRNGSYVLGGNSMVVNPKGDIIAQAGDAEEILYADVDMDLVDSWRKDFPILRDRVMF